MRIRLAGVIPMENGFALMHRQNVKNRKFSDYFVFPGGGREGEETFENGTIREIKEEFGIDVKVIKELYNISSDKCEEHFYLCKYIGGVLGTGEGPEFSGDPKYIESGTYTPVIVNKEDIKNTFILPPEIKEKLLQDVQNGKFDEFFN